MPRLALLALALLLAGCGSRPEADLPPAAAPAAPATVTVDGGRTVASLAVRRRVLELFDARTRRRTGRADAGVGPYGLASDGDNYAYVTDTKLDAVLVFRVRPELQLIRRLALRDRPTEIVFDRDRRRLYVTLPESARSPSRRSPHRRAAPLQERRRTR